MIGDIYHICNRGIRKEKIFDTNADYLRFVLNLYRLNNKDGSLRITSNNKTVESFPEQDKLVEVLKWTLLPNHYHLLLYEKVDGGVLEFVKRLGNSFTKYLNIKREASGYVFQNSAKIILIDNNEYLKHIPFYVDLNLVDATYLQLKNEKQLNLEKTIEYFRKYKWASFRDYFGENSSGFGKITNKELFYDIFDTNAKIYLKELEFYIKDGSYKSVDLFDPKNVNLAG